MIVLWVLLWGVVSPSVAQQGQAPGGTAPQGQQVPGGTAQQRLAPLLGEGGRPLPSVTIEGEVLRPGVFPLQPGMQIKHLIARAGGLIRKPDTVRGELLRITERGDLRVHFFKPDAALQGQRSDNLPLQVGDRVVIYTAVRGEERPTPDGLSAIEQLLAGRLPEAETPLRQFGYDLFAPVLPEPSPVEQGMSEQSGEPQAAESLRGQQSLESLRGRQNLESLRSQRMAEALRSQRLGQGPGEQSGTTPFRERRFETPAVDLRFAPVTGDVPVGPDYVIGPGDTLNIVLWGGVEDYYQVEVNRNGSIVLPRLGVVQVWGMTLQQVEGLLQQRFTQYYPDFQMAVTLGRLRTIQVYVMGEVQQAGAYTVSSLATMINALFVSGGPTKNGSLRHIRLLRQGKVVHTLDLYDFLLQGNKAQDLSLQSGDTIFVPVIGPVAGVAGNVRRPAIYELQPGTTLQRLLDLAGGVTPLGYLQQVHVERFVANERKVVVDLNLSAPRAETLSLWQTRLEDGDLIRIFPITTTLENVVQLEGHVVRPGRYELKAGMLLRDLLPSYDAVLPEPYLDYAEIVRYVGLDMHRSVVPFNLGALLAGDAAANLTLQPRDVVRIFARTDFADPHQVRISGLIHKPGIYPLTDGMRVRDLVLRAGNVHRFAYLQNAELTRYALRANGGTSTRVELDLEKALAGDPEHNLILRDLDHLLVRQFPGIEIQRDVGGTESLRAAMLPRGEGDGRTGPGPQHDTELSREARAPELFPLQENDAHTLAAMRRSGILQESLVDVFGEVRFPGTYPIQKGERLSSVLHRAGGFTDKAYLRGAVFTRQSVKEAQERRLEELLQQEERALLTESAAGAAAALSQEEVQGRQQALTFRRDQLNRLRAVRLEGRVIVRLQPLEVFASSPQDIEVEPGDRLLVPQMSKYVNVLGEVYNRTALIYEPGKGMAFYLEKVGGLTPQANEKEIFLVQVDGTVISNTQDQYVMIRADGRTVYVGDFFAVQPQPGDTIVVPSRVKTPATLRNVRDIVQIIFQSITTLGVIATLL
jgi:protein involved in polysaccharide export with SLBB domain